LHSLAAGDLVQWSNGIRNVAAHV